MVQFWPILTFQNGSVLAQIRTIKENQNET